MIEQVLHLLQGRHVTIIDDNDGQEKFLCSSDTGGRCSGVKEEI